MDAYTAVHEECQRLSMIPDVLNPTYKGLEILFIPEFDLMYQFL